MAIGQINGHPLKFLIDTGAAVTLVLRDFSEVSNRVNYNHPI